MITSSLVLYKSKPSEVQRVLSCVEQSIIDKVYVIDNSPNDNLRALVTQSSTKAEYIYGQGNVGFGEGNNIGIRLSMQEASDYHVIINPDIIFEGYVIKELCSFMDNHLDVGLIKPALTYVDGSFQAAAMLLPTPFSLFGKRLLPKDMAKNIIHEVEMQDVDLTKVREVANLSGSFMFVRTKVFENVGLFDDRYFMYFEDFDLVRRIHKKWKVIYYPKQTIIHAHAAEHRTNRKLLLISIKAAIKYFNKWGWIIDRDRDRWNRYSQTDNSIVE